ncbi:hypothetical protein M9H77_10958 [Catharanthus roseus]|uniref:Uncharacterized protein n=1 Tax=Catharanthus roseus TaxID=4058 RepID=A0ACC0BD51_CATRO|nr:hypothetical protein M9H77_10958 [Catharanthus roseus]
MAASSFAVLLLCILTVMQPLGGVTLSSPYLSPSTLFKNYEKMLNNFKIYIYNPQNSFNFSTPPSSIFHNSLINSQFVTQDPNQAHLFYIPFSPNLSARSIARLVKELRISHPYWNRTLGADHFFISPTGIDFSSDRNGLELKKNSVQISNFPTTSGYFIPHKDITLPPVNPSPLALSQEPANQTATFLCYVKLDEQTDSSNLIHELQIDAEFIVESEPSHRVDLVKKSKFCLFSYNGDVSWMSEAMALGCVPVILVDRPIQDLPLMDVLQWSEMAFLVAKTAEAKRLKAALNGVGEDRYQQMKRLATAASRHLVWNAEPQPHDAFHMVMYQLWLRRHTIRYARRESM